MHCYGEDKEKEDDDRKTKSQCNSKRVSLYYSSSSSQRSTALYVYVKDVEKIFTQAADSGAKVTMPLMDAFWGDRTGQLVDSFGHIWSFATRNRNLSQKEMQKAQQEWLAELGKGQ